MSAIVIKPEAAVDIREAFDYYEDNWPGLGSEFVDALDATLDVVQRGIERARCNPQECPPRTSEPISLPDYLYS